MAGESLATEALRPRMKSKFLEACIVLFSFFFSHRVVCLGYCKRRFLPLPPLRKSARVRLIIPSRSADLSDAASITRCRP